MLNISRSSAIKGLEGLFPQLLQVKSYQPAGGLFTLVNIWFSSKKNGFQWMNAFNPQVQEFISSLIKEVAINYNVDGIQGDDRLPAVPLESGYDLYTTNLYKSEHDGALPPQDYKDSTWINWRADLLTDYLGRLYREIKIIKPDGQEICRYFITSGISV